MISASKGPRSLGGLGGVGNALARRLLREARAAVAAHGLGRADSDDLAQMVALAAMQRFHTYCEGQGTLRQWVRGIARNEVRVLHRRRQGEVLWSAEPSDRACDVYATEEEAARRVLLARLLEQIPSEQRRAVLLIEIEGLTVREAARVLGLSPTRTHTRHQRGMAALREAARACRR
jgi:RNA polymerase sigma-70 factor (ECF subfamily)